MTDTVPKLTYDPHQNEIAEHIKTQQALFEAQERITELTRYKDELEERKKQHSSFIESLAKKLNLLTTSDEADILSHVQSFLDLEEKLRVAEQEKKRMEEIHISEVETLKHEIQSLRIAIEKQQEENKTLLLRVEKVEFQAEEKRKEKQAIQVITSLVESFTKLLKRKHA